MLCEYCGNLEPSSVCPAKASKIRVVVTEALARDFTSRLGYLFDRSKVARIAERFRLLEDKGVHQDVALATAVHVELEWLTSTMLTARQVKGLLTA
jgi:hypothetical protein